MIAKNIVDGNIHGIKFGPNLSITRLLFVDDIMIFGIGSVRAWDRNHQLINLFCKVSCMSINISKPLLLENEMDLQVIIDIKSFFLLQFSPLSNGSKYLGYFIKPNGYTTGD